MARDSSQSLLQTQSKGATIQEEKQRRMLACSLDELEREAEQLERSLIQALNRLRNLQGKKPVIVPKG